MQFRIAKSTIYCKNDEIEMCDHFLDEWKEFFKTN